jgi:ribosomal protein S18 acetylase RimI-like enzyme
MNTAIEPAYNELDTVRILFKEYSQIPGAEQCFVSFEKELRTLPGEYGSPKGRLYLAYYDNKAAGCIAVRPVNSDTCEIKRLYVRPEFRGHEIGRLLLEKSMSDSKRMGYGKICLETLPTMRAAISIYESPGFKQIKSYLPGTKISSIYLGLNI